MPGYGQSAAHGFIRTVQKFNGIILIFLLKGIPRTRSDIVIDQPASVGTCFSFCNFRRCQGFYSLRPGQIIAVRRSITGVPVLYPKHAKPHILNPLRDLDYTVRTNVIASTCAVRIGHPGGRVDAHDLFLPGSCLIIHIKLQTAVIRLQRT